MHWPSVINGIFSLFAAAGLTFVVLHPRIDEGPLIKLGLIIMIISLIATAMVSLDTNIEAAFSAGITLRFGLMVVCAGYALRFSRHKKDGEPTDFGSLTER
jgi:hypothetical protein